MRSEMFSVSLYCVVMSCSVMLYRVVLWWCDVKCLLFSPCCFVSFYCCDVMCAICFLFCFPVLRLMRCEISVLLRLLFCVLLWCDAKCFLFCFVWWYHVFCCYALLCCIVMMRCEMPSVLFYCVVISCLLLLCSVVLRCEMPSVLFRSVLLCCNVMMCAFCFAVLFYCVAFWSFVLFCFIVLCYGTYDSSPISSITTNEFSVACVRMWAVSSISDMNVDWCWTRLSLAPMRANTRSTIPVNHVKGNIFVSKHMILIALTNYWADNATFKK